MSLTVSVVIPCYNAEAFIADAVTSVLAQTYPVHEVVCVNDGSTDDTLRVLRELEARHPNLVRVLDGANGGAPTARNRGLRAAQGDYVQFLDADDLLEPDKLAHQVALICGSKPQPDFIAGAYIRQPFDGTPIDGYVVPVYDGDLWIALIAAELGITTSNLWKRQAVLDVGGWNEACRSSQDAELMFRMLRHNAVVLIDQRPTAVARRRNESIWNNDLTASLEYSISLRGEILAYLEEADLLTLERRVGAEATLFRRMRQLYVRDAQAAATWHRRLISSTFDPSREGCSTGYARVYRGLGFLWAERYHHLHQKSSRLSTRVIDLLPS